MEVLMWKDLLARGRGRDRPLRGHREQIESMAREVRMTSAVVVIVVVALSFDFFNGFHDAANSIATVVSTRVLSPQHGRGVGGVLQLRRVPGLRDRGRGDDREGRRGARGRSRTR